MTGTVIPRRRLMAQGVGLAVGTALAGSTAATLLAPPARATTAVPKSTGPQPDAAMRSLHARRRRVLTGRPSANGWEMHKAIDTGMSLATCPVPGTGLYVAVRTGAPEAVLVHVIRRFHYDIDALGRPGEPDPVRGWTSPSDVRDSRLPESNQASGTAVAIRPGSYPPSVREGFTPGQLLIIRDILADTEGTVRWGGDDRRPYEALFYLHVRPGDPRLMRVAEKIRAWNETPGVGAGVLADMSQTARRRAARYRWLHAAG
ncbi:hypothetical protein [Streptomyces sp. NPDC017941]|uniref:hypothetical protein n=1 Tax=Streptomyces sp. NPDC017941 TaxID=3365018 RepID=UPI00378EC907